MGPTFVINPSSDTDFTAFVYECAKGTRDVDELQECLRARYPKTVARLRALSGESSAVWYVYREGHWVAPDSDRREQ